LQTASLFYDSKADEGKGLSSEAVLASYEERTAPVLATERGD
jgi:hypothetical protein